MSAIIDQAREQMNKSVEATKENFMGIRTGRANPALLNGIMVDYYGAPTQLKLLHLLVFQSLELFQLRLLTLLKRMLLKRLFAILIQV